MAGPKLSVQAAVETKGVTEGVRAAGPPIAELTSKVRSYSDATRKAAGAGDELASSNRRQSSAAQAVLRIYQQQTRDLIALARAAKSGAADLRQLAQAQELSRALARGGGVARESVEGQNIAAQIRLQEQLRRQIADTMEARANADRVAGNLHGLEERTRQLREEIAALREGERAAREWAEAQQIKRTISSTGALPGSNDAEMVEREVRAQQRLEAELREVAAARERDRAAAAAAAAQQQAIASEIGRLREQTAQLGLLAAAHRRGGNAVQEANVSLQVRNALLRLGVSAGSADAVVIEQQIRAQHRLKAEIDQATAAQQRATTVTGGLRNAFYGLQAVLATLGLSALVRDAVSVALALERAEKSLIGATGSAAAARREMAFVRAESERLGLVLTDTSVAYGRIAAAAKGTVLEGQAVRDIFSAVSETATVLGLSADQTSGALLAVQQMMAKGRVTAEELVQQLSERLPNAYQAMATSLGISTQELAKRLEQGKVGLKDLIGWAEALRKSVAVGLPNAVNTFQARLNRLTNDINDLKASLGRGFLEGFLAGFQDLHGVLTDDELKQAARDLGESIGKGLRTAADAAAFLAKNLDLVKTVLLAIIALKAAAMWLAFAEAVKKAGGATIFLGKAMASLPLVAIAVVLAGLVVAMDNYISRVRAEHAAEMEKVQHSTEIFTYYNTLKGMKVGLTEAERAYAIELRKTLVAEKAKLEMALAAATAAAQGRARVAARPDPRTGYAPPIDVAATVAADEKVKELAREVQTVTNELNILNKEWIRLSNLPPPKLVVDDKGLDKTAKKIQDLLEGFRRAAEQAERVARAQKNGAEAARSVTQAIERENAAYQALHSIEGLSAAAKARLTTIIEAYVGRVQEATDVTAALAAQQQRDLDYTIEARQAEASLLDAKTDTLEASRALAAALAAEAIAREDNRSTDAEYIKQQTEAIRVRQDYLASVAAQISAEQRARDWTQELAGLQAQLADAQAKSASATRAHAVQLELEALLIAEGVKEWQPRGRQLREEVERRAVLRQQLLGQIAAQERLNEAKRREAGARAEFEDWRSQVEAARRYGTEVAAILDQYGLLAKATRELAIQEEILAAIRAEGVEIDFARGLQWNLEARDRQIAIEAEIRGQYEVLDTLQKVRAEHELLAYATAPLREAWQQTGETIKDVLADVIMGADVEWEDLLRSMLAQWVRALIEMLARWVITHRAMQAEAARTAAVNAAATSGGAGGAGGGGGMLGGAWGWFMNTGWGKALMGNPMTGGNSFMGGSGSGAMGAGIFAIVAAVAINWLEKKGTSWAKTNINFGGSQGIGIGDGSYGAQGANMGNNKKNVARVLEQALGLIKFVREFIQELGGEIDLAQQVTGTMSITKKGQGKKTKWIVTTVEGIVRNFGNDMDAAMEYAAIQAIKATPSYGLAPELVAAIKNSTAEKLDQFNKDVAAALAAVHARLGETGSQVYDTYRKHDQEIAAAKALGIATDALIAARDRDLQSIRDQLLGIDRSTSEYLASLISFQAGMDEVTRAQRERIDREIADTRAQIEQLLAAGPRTFEGQDGTQRTQSQEVWERNIQRLREQVDRYLEELDRIPKKLSEEEIDLGIFNALYRYLEGSSKYAAQAHKFALLKVELEFAAIQQQLIALGRWEEFAEMYADAYAAAREAAGKAGRRGGGGEKQQDRETLKGLLEDHDWAMKLRGLSEYGKQLAELNKKWDEAKDLAHGNAKELERIAKARKEEIEALREDARIAHNEELKPQLQDWGKSGPQVQLEALRKRFDDLRKSAKELGEPLWKVTLAQKRASQELGQAVINSLGIPIRQTKLEMTELGDKLEFLRTNAAELGLTAEDVGNITRQVGDQMYMNLAEGLLQFVDDEETRRELEQMRYDLTIAQYQLQFQMLKDMGLLTDAQVAKIQALFDKLPDVAPTTGGRGGGSVRESVLEKRQRRAEEAQREAEERQQKIDDAMERLRGFEDLALSPMAIAIRDVNEEFDQLRLVLGNTERVQAAYALAIQDVLDGFLDSVREFQKSLELSEFSPLEGIERLNAAQSKFDTIAAELGAGDLTHLDQLVGVGQDLLREALDALPKGSQAYRAIFDQVNSILNQTLEQFGGAIDDAAVTLPGGGSGTGAVLNLTPVVQQLQTGNSEQVIELRAIRTANEQSRDELVEIRQHFDSGIRIAGGIN